MKKTIKYILIALLILSILVTIALSMAANSVITSLANVRVEKNENSLKDFNLKGEQIEVSTSDNISINAYIVPNTKSKGNILILHGMQGMDATSLFDYAKFIFDAGYSPICIDMRAHGKSGGEALSFGYLETRDVLAVLEYLKTDIRFSNKPMILYGLSMGASTAINVAAKYEDIAAIIAISPFKSIQSQVTDYMRRDKVPSIMVDTFKPFINLALKKKYGVDPKKESPIETIKHINNIPILIVHGDVDSQTEVYQAEDLYDKCNSNDKELWIVEGKDHLIVEDILAEESKFYRDRIIKFLDRLDS